MLLEYSETSLYFQAGDYRDNSISLALSNGEEFDARVPKFDTNREDDFQLWSIQVKATLRGHELYTV